MKMKNSCVPWIGEIPEGWEVGRLKNIFLLQRGHDLSHDEFMRGSIPVQGSGGCIGFHNLFTTYAPNITIGRSGSVGKLEFINVDFWAHNTVIYVKNFLGNTPKYIFYILTTLDINFLSTKTAVPTLDRKNIQNTLFIYTRNFIIQQRLADFLDAKCAHIDDTITKEKELIEKLKEYRQSVITEAVTKGLNPNAPMKDSGIDWIGDIPEHWKVNRLKNLFILQRGHDLSHEEFKEGSIPVQGSGGCIGFHNIHTTHAPNITIGRSGSVGKLEFIRTDFWAHNTIIYVKNFFNSFPRYIFYILKVLDIDFLSTKTAVPTLDRKNIQNLIFPYTINFQEQQAIAAYLDKKTTLIDHAISQKELLIEKLNQYKKSLIYEAVTGKYYV